MDKRNSVVFLLVVVLAITIAVVSGNRKESFQPPEFQQKRVLRYSYEIINPTSSTLDSATSRVMLPLAETSNQRVVKIHATPAIQYASVGMGSDPEPLQVNIASFTHSMIAPYARKHIQITLEVATAMKANKVSIIDDAPFRNTASNYEVRNAQIQNLALELQRESNYLTAEAVHDWVGNNLKLKRESKEIQEPSQTLKAGGGQAIEIMLLTMTLLTANDIPALGVGGFVYKTNEIVSDTHIHYWVVAYIDNAWRVIDPVNRNELERTQDYIALRHYPRNLNKRPEKLTLLAVAAPLFVRFAR